MSDKNFCVKNMKKRHRADIRGLQLEANREVADENWYNSKVNLTRSYLNVYLMKCNDWYEAINDAIEKADVKTKKDSVVAVTSIYSASSDWYETHSNAEAMAYFKQCLDYEKTKGVVISAVIHYDETTPHMHVCSVPIIQAPDIKNEYVYKTLKDGHGDDILDDAGKVIYALDDEGNMINEVDSKNRKKRKKNFVYDDEGNIKTHKALSAQALFGGKAQMSSLQTEFFDVCGKPFGMERGTIRVNTEDTVKHKEELEFRESMVAQDMAKNTEDQIQIKKQKRDIDKKQKIVDDGVEIVAQYDNNLDVVLAEQERIQRQIIEADEEHYGEMADVYIMKSELEAKLAQLNSLIAEISEYKEVAESSERDKRTIWMDKHSVKGKTLNELFKEDLQKQADSLIIKANEYAKQLNNDLQKWGYETC